MILFCSLFGHNPPGGPCRRCGWTAPKPERRVSHYWGRVMLKVARPICWRLAYGVAAGLFALSVFTWAAPQLSPQEERRMQRTEDDIRAINEKLSDQAKMLYGNTVQVAAINETMRDFRGQVDATKAYVELQIGSLKMWGLAGCATIIGLLFANVLTLRSAVRKRTDTDSTVVDLSAKVVELLSEIKAHGTPGVQ